MSRQEAALRRRSKRIAAKKSIVEWHLRHGLRGVELKTEVAFGVTPSTFSFARLGWRLSVAKPAQSS
jgi:hypothetical protein